MYLLIIIGIVTEPKPQHRFITYNSYRIVVVRGKREGGSKTLFPRQH